MNKKSWLRVIGDVHCHIFPEYGGRGYTNVSKGAEYSIQLGDLGYPWKGRPNFFENLKNVDASHHMVVLGNHDIYVPRVHNALGDFGMHSIPLPNGGSFDFFYVRGAFSIDYELRTIGIDMWDEEELTWTEGYACVQAYLNAKPKIVFSHDCPEEIIHLMAQTAPSKRHMSHDFHASRTNSILQSCFEAHRPELWVFGHHHINWKQTYKDTTFMCLDGHMPSIGHQMAYIDFDEEGNLITPFPL